MKANVEPIDIIGSANAIQCYVVLISRRVDDPEILELGKKVLQRLETLQEEVRCVFCERYET